MSAESGTRFLKHKSSVGEYRVRHAVSVALGSDAGDRNHQQSIAGADGVVGCGFGKMNLGVSSLSGKGAPGRELSTFSGLHPREEGLLWVASHGTRAHHCV